MKNINDLEDIVAFDGGCAPSDCASCQAGCASRQGTPDEEHRTITLTMDDDTEVECAILTVFKSDGNDYIALLPLDENGQNQTGEVYLYRFTKTDSGAPVLANIEDDDEYAKAAEVFNEVVEKAIQAEENGVPLS